MPLSHRAGSTARWIIAGTSMTTMSRRESRSSRSRCSRDCERRTDEQLRCLFQFKNAEDGPEVRRVLAALQSVTSTRSLVVAARTAAAHALTMVATSVASASIDGSDRRRDR